MLTLFYKLGKGTFGMKLSEMIGSRMEIFSGKAGECALRVRAVTAEDVDAVLALQDYVIDCLSDQSLLCGSERDEIIESAEKDFCMGIFDGDRLAAFTQMVVNRNTPRNLGQMLGYPFEKCVYYEIVFVHPDYRGLGLQAYALRRRDEVARELGAELGFVTVSPNNAFSLKNIMASGFEVVERRRMYGGLDRYILKKSLV